MTTQSGLTCEKCQRVGPRSCGEKYCPLGLPLGYQAISCTGCGKLWALCEGRCAA